jgi:hypothetical protein
MVNKLYKYKLLILYIMKGFYVSHLFCDFKVIKVSVFGFNV